MKQILIIEASPRGNESASRKISAAIRKRFEGRHPNAKIVVRDLTKESLPYLDGATLKALATNSASSSETGRLSDRLTEELLDSDFLVIATPMWNFGIPPMVKAWLDLVVRSGKTFKYTEKGAVGLAKEKKAILVIASGGVFTEGPWKVWDFVDPYLRLILGFMGIEDVQTIRVEGLNIPALSASAVPNAEAAIEKLAL
jgi:FMN-dependent NADH-azoreductase